MARGRGAASGTLGTPKIREQNEVTQLQKRRSGQEKTAFLRELEYTLMVSTNLPGVDGAIQRIQELRQRVPSNGATPEKAEAAAFRIGRCLMRNPQVKLVTESPPLASRASDWIRFRVGIIRETDQAVCVELDGEDVWFPKSVVDIERSFVLRKVSGEGDLFVKASFARKEGLAK